MYGMTTWPDEPRVQHFACLALSNFAHDDANKVAIGQVGGNQQIVVAMSRHADHAGVQEQACGALANLGIHQQNMVEIAQLGGIELVVNALKKHPSHEGVQENACFALSKFLTIPNESYRQRMKKANAEEALSLIRDSNPSFDVRICVNVLLRRLTEEVAPQQQVQHHAQAMQMQGMGGQALPQYGQQQAYAMHQHTATLG